jgi:hypothetical protein
MDEIKNSKLSKVVSTKITDQEYKNLQRIAKYYQSRGYISKAKISEVTRLLLRKSMKWELSIMNHQETMNKVVTQMDVSESKTPITPFGKNSASGLNENRDNGQRQSQHSDMYNSNASSKERAQLLIDILNKNTKILTSAPFPGSYNKSPAEGLLAESRN